MESEGMIIFFKLSVETISSAKFIADILAVNMEASFGRHFSKFSC